MSSAACAPAPDDSRPTAQHPPTLGWALRCVRHAVAPPRTRALLELFERLRLQRNFAAELRLLVRRARLFTPNVADKVASLARSNPDAALETFISAFQREHFELDEAVCGDGFELWAESATECVPLLLRGTDRCNGIEPQGSRPGYALQWALVQDVFNGDERSEVIAEVAATFGDNLSDRLDAIDPPAHEVLCRRLTRSPYTGLVSFSRWALGDVSNPVLFYHQHHADELVLPWTRRGVARAARLVREANDFQAPMLALARWLEHAPAQHGPLLVDAVLGQQDARAWRPRGGAPGSTRFTPVRCTRSRALPFEAVALSPTEILYLVHDGFYGPARCRAAAIAAVEACGALPVPALALAPLARRTSGTAAQRHVDALIEREPELHGHRTADDGGSVA